jgi:hypothetical protein
MALKDTDPQTFEEFRDLLRRVVRSGYGQRAWDVITALRGPDSPSERPNMSPQDQAAAYAARRERKHKGVEVIRGHFVAGGSARSRKDINYVTLPPREEWDHHDKHVGEAAEALGLEIRIEENKPKKGEVKVGELQVKGKAEGKINLNAPPKLPPNTVSIGGGKTWGPEDDKQYQGWLVALKEKKKELSSEEYAKYFSQVMHIQLPGGRLMAECYISSAIKPGYVPVPKFKLTPDQIEALKLGITLPQKGAKNAASK